MDLLARIVLVVATAERCTKNVGTDRILEIKCLIVFYIEKSFSHICTGIEFAMFSSLYIYTTE